MCPLFRLGRMNINLKVTECRWEACTKWYFRKIKGVETKRA
jgi:hypothetical protein